MWNTGWRERIFADIEQEWDVIIVGGGITGAGVLRQTVNAGLKALLIEQHDFTFGTSSRSSKLVHGGFRYLREGQFGVTHESVREREWLLREAPNLVTPLAFLFPDYASYHVPMWQYTLGVTIYDLMAPKWDHQRLGPPELLAQCTGLRPQGLIGGYRYYDAAMDDSRVVLRLLRESVRDGGTALSYTKAEQLLKDHSGRVHGVILRDMDSPVGKTYELKAKVVVNASGPWSDELRAQVGGTARIRKLRGSHLVFSRKRWPLRSGATLIHPRDHRALFVIAWEGASMIGTTDHDQDPRLDHDYKEPFASREEIGYLLEGLNFLFPEVQASEQDILSTFAGLRPTLRSDDHADPSHVSRAHALFHEQGLITITGGKYTVFRIMARQTIEAVLSALDRRVRVPRRPIFQPLVNEPVAGIGPATYRYLLGRHGTEAGSVLACARAGELQHIDNLANVWAELRWAARNEGALHLDDLLLRRVRIGMLLPNGASGEMEHVRRIVQPEMGWDDARWNEELAHYRATWKKYYSPQPG
jgi:glycerol-3-phosphate dehydrogenase